MPPTVAVRVDEPGLTMKSVAVTDLPPALKVSPPEWLNVPRMNGRWSSGYTDT